MTRLIAVALVLVLSAACGSGPCYEPAKPDAAVLLPVAERRLVTVARAATAAAVGPDASLHDLGDPNPASYGCSDFSRSPPGSPWVSHYAWDVRGADPTRGPAYLARFTTFLRHHGWRERPSAEPGEIRFARSHYVLGVKDVAPARLLVVTASTGCLLRR